MLSPIVMAALTPNVRNRKLLVIYTHCYEIVKKKWSTKTSIDINKANICFSPLATLEHKQTTTYCVAIQVPTWDSHKHMAQLSRFMDPNSPLILQYDRTTMTCI